MPEVMILLAVFATAAAGLYDLKTTEVPEEIPALMVSSGLFYWFVHALTFGDFRPLLLSVSIGVPLLAAGIIAYRKGQWGEADAWVLAAVAFMVPLLGGEIFILTFLPNFFIVGAAYTVAYAVVLGLLNRGVFSYFLSDIKSNAKVLLAPLALVAAAFLTLDFYGSDALLKMSVVLFLLAVFWRYGKTVESRVFRRKVTTGSLKEGDVVEGMIWRGLTKEEVAEMKKKKKYVVVKEGIRFVPAFPLALIATVLYGNLLLVFI